MKIKKKSKYNGCNVTGREMGMAPQATAIASSKGFFSYCFTENRQERCHSLGWLMNCRKVVDKKL